MNKSDYYKHAIEVVAVKYAILPKIAIEVAKTNPKVFCQAFDAVSAVDPAHLEKTVRDIMRRDGKVPAIKYVRAELKLDLKAAKDYVDSIDEEEE